MCLLTRSLRNGGIDAQSIRFATFILRREATSRSFSRLLESDSSGKPTRFPDVIEGVEKSQDGYGYNNHDDQNDTKTVFYDKI